MLCRLGIDPRMVDPSYVDEWRERAQEVEARISAEEQKQEERERLQFEVLRTQVRQQNILVITALVGLITILAKR